MSRNQPAKSYRNRSVSGGINTRVFAIDIGDDEAVSLQNIDASTFGQRAVRGGTQLCASGITHGPVLALGSVRTVTGTDLLLAVSAGASPGDHKQLWSWNGQDTTFTHVAALSGFTADPFTDAGRVSITNVFDLNFTGGNDPFHAVISQPATGKRYSYNGSGTVFETVFGDGIGNPDGFAFAYHKNYAFGAGNAETKKRDTLFFSKIAQCLATGWSGGRAFRFGGDSANAIEALSPFRNDELLVFLGDRLEKLNITPVDLGIGTDGIEDGTGGTPSADALPFVVWSRETIDNAIGSESPFSVEPSGKDVFFADQHGNIRSVGRTIQDNAQGTESFPLSEPLDAWVKRINPAARKRIVAKTFDRWYVLGLPIDSATVPSHVFVYDRARATAVQRPTWDGPWLGLDVMSMTEATIAAATDSADQNPTLYIGQTATAEGRVMQMFRGTTDDGSPIVYQEETRRHVFGGLEFEKQGFTFDLFAVASPGCTMCVEVNLDSLGYQSLGCIDLSGDFPSLPQGLPFSLGGEGIVKHTLRPSGLGPFRDVQVRMTCTATQSLKVLGYTLLVHEELYKGLPGDV